MVLEKFCIFKHKIKEYNIDFLYFSIWYSVKCMCFKMVLQNCEMKSITCRKKSLVSDTFMMAL